MKLQPKPFEATKAGFKTIEIRLNDEKRRTIRAGDTLEFQKVDSYEILSATVLAVRSYQSMSDLVAHEAFKKTGNLYLDQRAWVQAIDSYYSKADQKKYGLLSIEIAVVS